MQECHGKSVFKINSKFQNTSQVSDYQMIFQSWKDYAHFKHISEYSFQNVYTRLIDASKQDV